MYGITLTLHLFIFCFLHSPLFLLKLLCSQTSQYQDQLCYQLSQHMSDTLGKLVAELICDRDLVLFPTLGWLGVELISLFKDNDCLKNDFDCHELP